jgi:hypothetical protein
MEKVLLVDNGVFQRNACSFALEIQRVGSFRTQDIVCIVGYCGIAIGRTLFFLVVALGTGRLASNILRKLRCIVFSGQNVTEELTH